MEELVFIVAGCGYILSASNLGGNCLQCGKFCCKRCLTTLTDRALCPTCLKKRLRDKDGFVDL